ncbi:MAG TPA: hypothetical protein VIM02_09375 [Rhizomicrobium sp.]
MSGARKCRARFYSVILALVAAWVPAGNSALSQSLYPITDPSALLPPVFPRGESPEEERPDLARHCEDSFQASRARHRFSFGQPAFTRAAKWGDIVRIDYLDRMEGTRARRINRVVCFRRAGPANFNIGYYENVPSDSKQRVWFSGVILHLDDGASARR